MNGTASISREEPVLSFGVKFAEFISQGPRQGRMFPSFSDRFVPPRVLNPELFKDEINGN